MTLQTRSNNSPLPSAINSILVAAAIGAIAIAAFTLRPGESSPRPSDANFFLAASGSAAEVSASELLAAGIAEHSAYFPPLAAVTNAPVRDVQAELAAGIAEHSAYFPPLAAVTNAPVRDVQAELAAGIAEHSAYFPPVAAVTGLSASDRLAAEMAQHEALTEAYFGPATAPRRPFAS